MQSVNLGSNHSVSQKRDALLHHISVLHNPASVPLSPRASSRNSYSNTIISLRGSTWTMLVYLSYPPRSELLYEVVTPLESLFALGEMIPFSKRRFNSCPTHSLLWPSPLPFPCGSRRHYRSVPTVVTQSP